MGKEIFILAGNGPYLNRGCEAIVRGTAEILRNAFDKPELIAYSFFRCEQELQDQRAKEIDEGIYHEGIILRASRNRYLNYIKRRSLDLVPWLRASLRYSRMKQDMRGARAILSIGGDNYSLDYGTPTIFTDLDDYTKKQGGNLIIWGASIGPFSERPDYEEYMASHLKSQRAIFVREDLSLEYLHGIGVVENVYKTVDPAIVMPPRPPKGQKENHFPEGSIAINLSPLLSVFVCGGDDKAWFKRATDMVDKLAKGFDNPIILVPHVIQKHSDDYSFLLSIKNEIGSKQIMLTPRDYGAQELKWVISKSDIFIGARFHSTIAAVSSGVPTIFLSYSYKAEGFCKDIYGGTKYSLTPAEIEPVVLRSRAEELMAERERVVETINKRVQELRQSAYSSGIKLRQLLFDE